MAHKYTSPSPGCGLLARGKSENGERRVRE